MSAWPTAVRSYEGRITDLTHVGARALGFSGLVARYSDDLALSRGPTHGWQVCTCFHVGHHVFARVSRNSVVL